MNDNKKKVLILGGGFGGIKAALDLSESDHYEVTLISDSDSFRYYPTLYHAATGGRLDASRIPLSEIFDRRAVKLINDKAEKIDRNKKTVKTSSGKNYEYDALIIALGVVTNYFGIKGLQEYAYGIKSVEEATRLREHLHKLIIDEGKPDLNYVVIGGGPTGVELAGALPGYLREIMKRHGIEKRSVHVDLVEAAPRLMPRMSEKYSRRIARRLRRLGVKLYLNEVVSAETPDELDLKDGHSIKSHTVIWTAGVTNHPFFTANKFQLNERGKVVVDAYLQAEEDIFVIGDNADTKFSGMAQTALYDARFVAANLKREAHGKLPYSYEPKEPDYVTPVGPNWAAAIIGKFELYGILGWFARSAADFIAYHDLEPWWRSSKHWAASNFEGPETCKVCSQKH
ncbi:MAG TPA: FAD-dependent oxidoreductase [Candidatus Saccharimonadales bacterium]|nr:FAD-dependent oxidoreductase [Candidatus Saccharimonadales bacterium]